MFPNSKDLLHRVGTCAAQTATIATHTRTRNMAAELDDAQQQTKVMTLYATHEYLC